MYAAYPDPYCYLGTDVLKNKLDLRNAAELEEFEAASVLQRSSEPLPSGRLSVTHYRAVHRHLFQDVYAWSGRFRTVRIAKDGNVFCYPENILAEMSKLFDSLGKQQGLVGLQRVAFSRQLASFLATLNAIHPFREGNGRTQMAFAAIVASQSGFRLELDRLIPDAFLAAMIASFTGTDDELAAQLYDLMG